MKKFFVFILLISISIQISAEEFEITSGFGFQNGGIIGVQFANKTPIDKYYLSLGFIGASLGYERALESYPNHTFGINLGANNVFTSRGFIHATYNYHVNGFANKGFVFGFGLGVKREREKLFVFRLNPEDTEYENEITTQFSTSINISYKF